MKKNTSIVFLLFFLLFGQSDKSFAYSLPFERSVKWEGNVGVLNDIPKRSNICSTLDPVGGDNYLLIQNAIDNCPSGQVVKLNSGIFNIGKSIRMKSGVTLRGSGMGRTVIKGSSSVEGSFLLGMTGSWQDSSSIALSGKIEKGSKIIETSTPHGWNKGDLVIIDQINNPQGNPAVTNQGNNGKCSWCGRTNERSLGQIVKIQSVISPTSVEIEIPLYWSYDSNLLPQGTRLNGITKDAGIEDLTVDNIDSGSSKQSDNGGTIVMRGTSNSWLSAVEVIGSYQNLVHLYGNYRNTIRNGKFHEVILKIPGALGPGRGYGIRIDSYSSANLFENNQVYNLSPAFVMNGEVSGNVIAYNYIHDMLIEPSNWQAAAVQFHGAHPMMNLIEGNDIQGRFNADNTWGSSSHNTAFRNKITLKTNGVDRAMWDVDLQYNANYFNLIGNVIGTQNVETVYQYENVTVPRNPSIYRLGYNGDGDTSPTNNDNNVLRNVLRHGNWDSFNKNTLWDSNISDHQIPKSLYLSSKPSWWGNNPWPAIGPDLSPMVSDIPAKGETETCESFMYTQWSECQNGFQTRDITESYPTGCEGGNPILSQTCQNERYTIEDFAIFKDDYKKTNNNSPADINGDSMVDLRDLGIMMSYWQQ